jgi:site-specific recombinase XerD
VGCRATTLRRVWADVTAATITLYVRDMRHFVAWLAEQARACDLDSITPGDIRDYRTLLLERRRAPATINRILSSLRRFFDDLGWREDNPARPIDRVEVVEQAPQALSRTAWNAVRRAAEQHLRRDRGLGLALSIMRCAGLRVSEVAALQPWEQSLSS